MEGISSYKPQRVTDNGVRGGVVCVLVKTEMVRIA